MPDLQDLISTYLFVAFGVGYAAFFLGAIAACLAPLLLVEGTALLSLSPLRLRLKLRRFGGHLYSWG